MSGKKIKVLSIFGTRPEAVKMCPLVRELQKNEYTKSCVCVTGQHKEMLYQVMEAFSVKADYDLEIMKSSQTLNDITALILQRLPEILKKEKPDIVLVHGDTSTSFAAALAAFYEKIPVGHVEAGLRTGDIYSPYPEEMNRRLTGQIASIHFAPTYNNRKNLIQEGITEQVFVTGNTVMDSFKYTVCDNYRYINQTLGKIVTKNRKIILMTAHRRENLGEPLKNICLAVKEIVENNPNVEVVYPVHLNPTVRETVFSILNDIDRVHLTEPLCVTDMHNIMSKSYLILTDSGGLQEEGPHFGVPVLVLRKETERPEAVEAGTVKIAGVEKDDIVRMTGELLMNADAYEKMAVAVNPYGDGHASERIVKEILNAGIYG